MLRSDLYDYSDAYIVVKEREYVLQVVIMLTEEMNGQPLRIILHLHHAYQKLITHLQKMHLVIVMLMYKLLEYSENYFKDEVSDDANENNDSDNYRVNNQQGNNK